ncbi:MAG: TonB-dependent receptor [Gammaproteobacteria bacterium]|nr:TonB-dependent receptor [Gammaproteobacteria bacterium]
MSSRSLRYAISAVIAAAPMVVSAQESTSLEEVIVTAQRRAESLQTTPVSVTAITAEALADRQIGNVIDIAVQVPNLRIEPVTGLSNAARVFLRGVGEDQSTPTTDSAIGLYIDGVYYPRTLGALFDLSDIERVEVLRGPQGTLYGRNTSGGAIRIITKDPGEAMAGSVDFTAGNYDRRQVRATIGGPLGDTLKGSLSLLGNQRDGTSKNTTLGKDVNAREVESARGKLVWSPTDTLEFKLAGDWTEDSGDSGVGTSAFSGYPADLFVTAANADPSGYLRTRGVALTATWEFGGAYTLTSITAWRDLQNTGTLDNDAEARTILHFFFDAEQDQLSQEFTLQADWGRTKAILGAYWFTEDNLYESINYSSSRTNPNAAITATRGITTQDTESYALFGQVSFAVTDALTLTAGGRYTWDDKDFSDRYPTLNRLFEVDKEWTAFTPRLAVDYKATDDLFFFASWSKGYKAGGFNRSTTAITALTPYDQEDVETLEGGVKAEFLDGRLRTNLTLFHNDYTDLQLSAFDPATNVSRRFNAAAATTKGVELELTAIVVEGLRVYGTYGYLDAQYDEFFDRVGGVLTDVSYLDLKGAPEQSYAFGFSWDLPLPIPGLLRLNGDLSHRTRMENNVANTPIIATPPVTLVNASLVWTSEDERWTASIAGKNLGDEHYLGAGLYIGGLTTVLYPADPLTYTASVGFKF